MSRALVVVLLAAAALGAWQAVHRSSPAVAAAQTTRYADPAGVPDDVRAAGLRFAAGTSATDRTAVQTAIAAARPEARALIALVDGLVAVRIAAPGGRIVGTTQPTADGYLVVLDLARAAAQREERGIARLVLHELGHVVDHALLSDALRVRLDAGIPRGWGCEGAGTSGACAAPAERFAESFAKWATGDIGVDIELGYRVPPPSSLETWGVALAALARAAG